jgi:hypothetical protein
MDGFEEKVLADLSELKVHVRYLVGGGNEGKIQEIEQRLRRHESYLQRLVGLGSALAAAITVLNLVANFLRLHR